MPLRARRLVVLSLALAIAGCVAPAEESSSLSAPMAESMEPSLPWTQEFMQKGLIVAEEIHVEGPDGLIGHFAARIEEPYHVRDEETTVDGYRQEFRVRPDGPMVEIRGYLDRVQLVATSRLTVLERPGDVDVIVEARGDVFQAAEGATPQRGSELRLVGKRPY